MNKTKHAVITDTQLVVCEQTGAQNHLRAFPLDTKSMMHASEIWYLGKQYGVTHFWIMPGTRIDKASNVCIGAQEGYYIWQPMKDGQPVHEQPQFVSVSKAGIAGATVFIGWAHRLWRWTIEKPIDILSSIAYLEKAVGVPVEWGPGHMALALINTIHSNQKHREWTREPSEKNQDIPYTQAARDLVFKRQLESFTVGMYLHHFDKNSAYLAGCMGGTNGCGDPVHVTTDFDLTLPGIYRVTVDKGYDSFDGDILPEIVNTPWITQEVLAIAMKHYTVTVQEAWVFPEHHRMLDKFAGNLWGARNALKDDPTSYPYEQGRMNAYSTVKEIACIGVGTLATKRFEHRFDRANWWADVVGRARANMFRNLARWLEQGYLVNLIYNDGIFVVSPESDPRQALPGILDREGQLGGYKHEYTLKVTDEMVGKFQELSPAMLISYLHGQADHDEEGAE